jgi:hypothetical protein
MVDRGELLSRVEESYPDGPAPELTPHELDLLKAIRANLGPILEPYDPLWIFSGWERRWREYLDYVILANERRLAATSGRDVAPAGPKRRRESRSKRSRGKLDEDATLELTRNPSLTYEQLAVMLGCSSATLRDRRKCPLLVATKARIKAKKREFYRGDEWNDRSADEE